MIRHKVVLIVCCLSAGLSGAAVLPDCDRAACEHFSLWLEQTGDAEALVVASWPDVGSPDVELDGVLGWSWAVCHDPAEATIDCVTGVLEITEDPDTGAPVIGDCDRLSLPLDIATCGLDGGAPDWLSLSVHPEGVVQGMVLDFTVTIDLDAKERFEMLSITYHLQGESARLDFCDAVTSPAITVRTVFSVYGESFMPATREGITLTPRTVTGFKRGDVNADGTVDLGDPVCVLTYLFSVEDEPCKEGVGRCLDAADANDDGAVNVADAIRMVYFLFGRLDPLPVPFGACGDDETPDELGCLEPRTCP